MDEIKEKVRNFVRNKLSIGCLNCAGEFCNCDGSHDEAEMESLGNFVASLVATPTNLE